MLGISQQPVPDDSLLRSWRGGVHPERWLGTGDCFTVRIERPVSLAEFVVAFYTAPVFRLERWILRVMLKSPSSDADAEALAVGRGETFAVWVLCARSDTQLLVGDRFGRTRSWFSVVPEGDRATTLRFGSAVARAAADTPGGGRPGLAQRLLGRFHVRYSEVLLAAARRRLLR